MSAADAQRRTSRLLEANHSARLVAILEAVRPLHAGNTYHVVRTAVASGPRAPDGGVELLLDLRYDRAGRVRATNYTLAAFELPSASPTREPGDPKPNVSDADVEGRASFTDARVAAATEAARREGAERLAREREEAYAAHGKRLVMSGMLGRAYELPPDHRLAVELDARPGVLAPACCWCQAMHAVQHLRRGRVDAPPHADGCASHGGGGREGRAGDGIA